MTQLIVFSGLGLGIAGAGGLLLELFSIRQKYVEVLALMIIQAAVVPIYVVHMTMSQYTILKIFRSIPFMQILHLSLEMQPRFIRYQYILTNGVLVMGQLGSYFQRARFCIV